MRCPKCNTENREGRRFCAKCGAALATACPECGFANEPDEEFCGGCGKTLATGAVLRSDSTSKHESPDAERRQLTVMFCDLVGSTALAERLDPEELRELLAQYQDTCASVIHRYEAYIARYVGDGLLVYFGYPQAHEDDAQRGVRAGLSIVEAIRDLDTKIANPDVSLAVRIGITTGLVVAGDIGSGERVEAKAIVGETPNLAARLQALAEPNAVVIGAGTQRLVEGLFDCDNLGEQRVKNISKPLRAYQVRAESGVPSRFEAKATRGLSPLVGREEEISLFRKRWIQATEGESQVVLLSGEAGVGKSRIVRAFQEPLEGEIRNRVLYYCSPYHQNSALYPAINQLERALRWDKGDSPEQKLDKLESVLGDLNLATQDFVPPLASLLALPVGERYPPLDLGPEQLKRKTLEALVALIEAMASKEPVLMVVEDIHWIDPSTLEFIGLLIEQLRSARFLLAIIFRPEFVPPWGSRAHVTALTLNRLTRKDSKAMIENVARGKALPDEIVDRIVGKTDGVPLFIEELTKTMLESDLLEDAGDRFVLAGPLAPLVIPASLQDSLMARLDRLAPAKEVAQLAATLGRTFSHELLAAVSSLNEKALEEALAQLVKAELIYRRGVSPDARYEFKHALVQEAAYQSLLKSTRQQYHERIARVLEERFSQTTESEPELLAHHYTEAHLPEQAVRYWQRAGEQASERSAHLEVVAHLTKGLELLKTQPESPARARSELDLFITLGPALTATKGPASSEVGQAYLRGRELSRRLERSSQLFTATWGMWDHHQFRGELRTALDLAEEVLALAEQHGDPEFRLQAHHAAWTTRLYMSQFALCRANAEQGIALYDIDKHRSHAFVYGGHDPGVCACCHFALSLWFLGYPEQALARSTDAVKLAERLSYPFTSVQALSFSCWIHHCRRGASYAEQRAEEAIKLCTKHNVAPHYLAFMLVLRGWALAVEGRIREGVALMEKGIGDLEHAKSLLRRAPCLVLLADTYRAIGEAQRGLNVLEEARRLMEEIGERWCEVEIYRVNAELLLSQSADNQAAAEACFNRAVDVARRQNAKSWELRAATSLSRLWGDQGKRKEAHDLLARIYGEFTEGFDTADLKEAKALLDALT